MSTSPANGDWEKGEHSLIGRTNSLYRGKIHKQVVMFQFDDRRLEHEWSISLENWGISCASVSSFDMLRSRLQETQLILFNACRIDVSRLTSIASAGAQIPLIAIGKNIDTLVKARLLESGVEDCIETICHGREMVARVRAILRRLTSANAKKGVHLRFDWAFDPVRREVRAPTGASVRLNKFEFDLMRILIERPDKVFSADELGERVTATGARRSNAEIVRALSRIRSKLAAISPGAQSIYTIQHKGYRLRHALFE